MWSMVRSHAYARFRGLSAWRSVPHHMYGKCVPDQRTNIQQVSVRRSMAGSRPYACPKAHRENRRIPARLINLQTRQSQIHEHGVYLVDPLIIKHLREIVECGVHGYEAVRQDLPSAFAAWRAKAPPCLDRCRSDALRTRFEKKPWNAPPNQACNPLHRPLLANAGATRSTQSRSNTG